MSVLFKKFARFGRREEGSATIEFVFLFPLFMTLFLMGFESGFYMVRNVMLERSVDIAVRDIRLGNGKVPEMAALKERICEVGTIIPDCENSVQVYMTRLDPTPGSVAAIAGPARCVDKSSTEDQDQFTSYDVGDVNSLMFVQVCAVAEPFFPTTGIGIGMQKSELAGNYAIVASAAFVNEPGTRAIAPYSPPVSSGSGTGDGSDDGSADGTTSDPTSL